MGLVVLLFIMMGMLISFFNVIFRFIYSSTNNLFLTLILVASIIFLMIGIHNSINTNYYDGYSYKGFMDSGGIYYTISGVLLIISFIIYLLSNRSTNRINTSRINTSRKI